MKMASCLRIWVSDSAYVQKTANDMLDMLLEDNPNVLKDILQWMKHCLIDADITILDVTAGNIIATTVNNADSYDEMDFSFHAMLRGNNEIRNLNEITEMDASYKKMYRCGVKKIVAIPLKVGNYVLFVEYFSLKNGMALSKMEVIYKILAIAIKLHGNSDSISRIKDIDPLTGIYSRSKLYDDLREICSAQKKACLCVIAITNAGSLNSKYNVKYVDRMLGAVGHSLKEMHLEAYRLSGTKFAIVLPGDVDGAYGIVETAMDRILALDAEMEAAGVLTEIGEEIYHSIHVCESNLKYAKNDMITVVRQEVDSTAREGYVHVATTHFTEFGEDGIYSDKGRGMEDPLEPESSVKEEKKEEMPLKNTIKEQAKTKSRKLDVPEDGSNGAEKTKQDSQSHDGENMENDPALDYHESMTDEYNLEFDGEIPSWAYESEGGERND